VTNNTTKEDEADRSAAGADVASGASDHLGPVSLQHSAAGAAETDSSHPLKAGAPVRSDSPTFAELGVKPEIVRALSGAGIERTFAIQELTLPLALAGEDLIGQARTGTGKTLGFGVPLLQRLVLPGDGTPQALVVVPTRELCLQVSHDITDAGKHLGVRTVAIYGGRPYEPQVEALRNGVDLVIGTPGRLLDLAEQRHLVLGKVRGLVLDEADEMLDLGFLPDVERILRMMPESRQTMLFSATMPGPIITMARTFLNHPTHIRAENNDVGAIHERTKQFVYRAHAMDKTEVIARTLQAKDRGLTLIFTRTKRTAQKLSDDLTERGFAAAAVHGDLGQGGREQALRAFRSGKVDTLVATDVAARGIDIEGITHVINYQCPEDDSAYVHRIGRTGRAGREGVAVTLVDWDEETRWKLISDTLGLDMPEPVETYSTSEHLFTDLDIPRDTTGRLPLGQRTRAGLAAEEEEDLTSGRGGRGKRAATPRRRSGSKPAERPGNRERSESAAPTDNTGEGGAARPRRRRTRRGGAAGSQAEARAEGSTESNETPAASSDGHGADREPGQRAPRQRRRRRSGVDTGTEAGPTAQQSTQAAAESNNG